MTKLKNKLQLLLISLLCKEINRIQAHKIKKNSKIQSIHKSLKYPKSNFIKDSFFNTEFHEMMDKQREISTFNRKISKSQTHLRKQHEHELNKLILFTNQKREYKNCQKDKTISFTTYANQQSIQQKVSSKVIFNLQKLCYLTLKL